MIDFIPIDDRTQQELEDDDYNSFESESEIETEEIDTTSAWDPKQTKITNPGPIVKLSADYNEKDKAATKIKKKTKKKNRTEK